MEVTDIHRNQPEIYQKCSMPYELQDPKDKRSIRADEKLLAVFDGKEAVSMFEMTKLVNGHLV
jgi:chromatin remodeling complex protein RSC6